MATEWSLDPTPMAPSGSTLDAGAAVTARQSEWQRHRGDWVTVHVITGTYESKQAAAELRAAERAAAELARLLSPPPERRGAPLDIYLTGKLALSSLPGDEPGTGPAANPNHSGIDSIVRVIQPDDPGEPIVWPLTRHLLARWFGPEAASTLLTGGIAGVIAARIEAGLSVADADTLVRNELDAGRPVSIFTVQTNAATDDSAALNQAIATSFVAAVIAHSGADAVRDYLAAYDPERRDSAAIAAFHRPIGALEELWLTTLRRGGTRSTPFRLLFRYLVPLLRPHLWRQLEIAGYMAFGIAFGLILPLAMKYLVDVVLPGGSVRMLLIFISVLFVLYVLDAAVDVRRNYVNSRMYQRILVDLQTQMFTHLQHLPHGFFATAKVGDLMSRLTADMGAVQQAIATFAGMGIYLAVSAVAAAVTLLILSPLLGGLVILVVPLFAVSYLMLRQRSQAASLEYQTLVGQTATAAQENLSAQPVIKAFRLESWAINTFSAQLASLTRAFTRLTVINSLFGASMSLATTLGQLLVLGVGGYLVMSGSLTLGTLLAFLALLPSLFQPVSALSGVGQTVQRATGALERVTELLDTPLTISSPPGAPDLPPLGEEIRLEDVSFSYLPGQPILRDLSLTIEAGHNVAIVGPSGCGKSTLVNLLMRFYDPDSGHVRFDGHDLREVTLPSVRGQISIVFQDTFVFDTTLRQNIAIGRPEATDAEIVAVAEAAQLGDFIAGLPAGYDTVLGERGVRMSGGQRQRLAIARALLSDPRILILDEATSALDPGTEAEIQAVLQEAARGRTTISITHRLASVTGADCIYVMDRGRVVETGTFEHLVTAGGLFQRLYSEQVRHGQEAAPESSVLSSLRDIPLFQGLDPDAVADVSASLRAEQVAAGTDIVRQGDPGESLYLIVQGTVEVLAASPHGERRVNTLSAGDYFGEMALVSEELRVATVRAVAPTDVYRLDRDDFVALLDQQPDLRAAVEATISERQAGLAAALASQSIAPGPA